MRPPRTVVTFVLAMTVALGVTFVVPLASSTPTSSAAEAALRKSVTSDYTLLRRAPASYVIGTAYRGWTVDIQGPAESGYRWGRIFGDLNACLWIYAGAVAGSGSANESCQDAATMPTSAFTNGVISPGADDGSSIAVVAGPGCATYDGAHLIGYGNVRPWLVPARASSPIPTSLVYGSTVRWRYVSRDGAFVMVRDPASGSTDGRGLQSWFFLPRGCFP